MKDKGEAAQDTQPMRSEMCPIMVMLAEVRGSEMGGLERMPRVQLGNSPDANAPSASDE
jgi:hypothetical protein